jgi:hypothetical protein
MVETVSTNNASHSGDKLPRRGILTSFGARAALGVASTPTKVQTFRRFSNINLQPISLPALWPSVDWYVQFPQSAQQIEGLVHTVELVLPTQPWIPEMQFNKKFVHILNST